MSSQNLLFRHLRPPKLSKGSTRNGLKNTLKIDAHFFSKSTKSVPKREGDFRATPLIFRPFLHFGPKWCLGPPPEGPRTSFDPVFSHFGQPLGRNFHCLNTGTLALASHLTSFGFSRVRQPVGNLWVETPAKPGSRPIKN